MRSEVKERIEKIDQEIAPEGYKKTKIGIIPEDWELKSFQKEFKVNQGLQIPIRDRYKEKVKGSYVYITNEYINNLNNNNYKREYIKNPKENVICNYKDILMTRTGNTGIVISKVEGVFHNNFFKIDYEPQKYSQDFLIELLKSNYIQHSIIKLSGIGTIPDLTHSDFYSLESSIPPLQEQEKIADILSTWDKAIETIEKLIKEKEIQKKGLMQELLTGERRLPGFSGEWNEVKLGEVAKVFDGVHQTPSYKDEGVPFVSVENIKNINETEKYISEEDYIKDYVNRNKKVEKNDILMTRIGSIGVPHLIEEEIELAYYVTLALIKLNTKNINSKFLYHMIQSDAFQQELFKKTLHVAYPNKINLGEINLVKFKYPSLKEQKAIAEILSTADKEIELLRELLVNKKEEKKGLMQLLLTGIVRV